MNDQYAALMVQMPYRQEAPGESAEEALRQRFARSEMSEEEFAETLRVLRESRQAVPA